jgi:hypothetical protein
MPGHSIEGEPSMDLSLEMLEQGETLKAEGFEEAQDRTAGHRTPPCPVTAIASYKGQPRYRTEDKSQDWDQTLRGLEALWDPSATALMMARVYGPGGDKQQFGVEAGWIHELYEAKKTTQPKPQTPAPTVSQPRGSKLPLARPSETYVTTKR